MKNIFFAIVLFTILSSCSENKRLIKKAEIATGRMEYQKAIGYYDQVLEKDKESYRANTGKGIVLSDFMGKYDVAIPYLEKALSLSPKKDTLVKINYNLGKAYHYTGNYNKALYYYGRVTPYNETGDSDADPYLNKRIADCKYALKNTDIGPENEQNVKNAGNMINTENPEYAPVSAGNNLYFTSKKQDDEKEKVNGWDGKYFESMYVSSFINNNFSKPERYTIPDLDENSKFQKHNEAVISVADKDKKMYIYRDGKIYEANIDDPASEASIMDKTINFSRFQNHASVSGDGKILFFTGESKNGKGGTDIYSTAKDKNGKWSEPQILDTTIVNTIFNEEAPFYSESGVLYFSSDGLPGYGGFDIYKTSLKDGKWTTPENLGQPINSPGDDIFFVLNRNSPDGYYSSNRIGGFGDMDIYHVHYVSTEIPECSPEKSNLLAINHAVSTNENPGYYFVLKMPDGFEKNVRSIEWKINDSILSHVSEQFQYKFNKPGNYKLNAKVVVYCDTCPSMLTLCSEKRITIEEVVIDPPLANIIISDDIKNEGYLNSDQLAAINYNSTPLYFGYDQHLLREDAIMILNNNIKVLKKNKDLAIDIIGFTDSRGSIAYNQKLAEKRINSVKRYLLSHGISKNRIIASYALGETKLTICTDNMPCEEEQHQLNRKVEINVMHNIPKKRLTSVKK